jgi:type IV pilus assembly protein PilB
MSKNNLNKLNTVADVLYSKNLITSDQLSAIKFESVNTGKSVDSIIKDRGYVSSDDYANAFGEVYGIEFAKLTPGQISPELLDKVPLDIARKYKVIPFEIDANKLSLAMVDPLDLQTIDFIERRTGLKVVPFITTEKMLDRVLDEQKGKELGEEITAAMEEITQNTIKIEEGQADMSDATIKDAPIARVVGMILETSVKSGASDVHIEPGEDACRLRYRVDGILSEKRKLPKEMTDPVVARIKILAGMKIDEKRVPQDGRFKVQVGKTETDLRVSTLPTVFGEKVVIRLLKEEGTVFTYRDLGMRGLTLKRYEEMSLKPNGMILVTGPTSSGKTVTLASTLNKLNTIRVNIVTIEDPVEIRVPGVNQVQVNPQAGLTFASGLRAFLRQDPNIIMVGEIRDGETAELAVHAALTGHLVLSTLHTNSASGAIPRLLDMDIEDFFLSSTILGVLAQRLVRKVCPYCKEEYEPPKEILEDLKSVLDELSNNQVLMTKDVELAKIIKEIMAKDKLTLFRGKGCPKCDNGYKGRVGIFELLAMSEKISEATLSKVPSSKIEEIAKSEGMITLLQDGYVRALQGDTTLEEIMRVTK